VKKPLQTVNQTVHLGSIRADKNDTNLSIQEHISIARKTLYSLFPVGLNGKNGLNPVTAYKTYHAYALPSTSFTCISNNGTEAISY
jgi:hypothetical protein